MRTYLTWLLIVLLFTASRAFAQSPPAMPTEPGSMYSLGGSNSVITIGDSTTDPETIETQPDADVFFFPWEGGPDYPYTPSVVVPPYDNPPSSFLECLDDQAQSNITFFDVITDNFVDESMDWVNYSDMVDSLTTVLDAVNELFDTSQGSHVHEIWCWMEAEGYHIASGYGLIYNGPTICNCGANTRTVPEAPSSMPSYSEAEPYYDAVAELEEKLAAVWYNFWLDVNENIDNYGTLGDVNDALDERIEKVLQDFAYDVANAWYAQ